MDDTKFASVKNCGECIRTLCKVKTEGITDQQALSRLENLFVEHHELTNIEIN